MEFFEFVLIISLTVGLPITLMKTLLDYKKSKLEAQRELGEGAGLTVGELKKLLKEAVREANAPLLERLEALEGGHGGLPPSGQRDLLAGVKDVGADDDLADMEDPAAREEIDKSVGRRVHG